MIRPLAGLARDWRAYLALAAATAIAAATLSGGLTVGDSVRGSLRAGALDGLGDITHLVRLEGSFPHDLAIRLQQNLATESDEHRVAPLALARASVRSSSGARAGSVDVLGVDAALLSLFGLDASAEPWSSLLDPSASRAQPPMVLDQTLAEELGVEVGDFVVAAIPRWSDIPTGSVLAKRDVESTVRTVRGRVVAVVADRGIARMALQASSASAPTLILPLSRLAAALDRVDRADTLAFAIPGEGATSRIEEALRAVARVDDLGLELVATEAGAQLTSREVVLRDPLVATAEDLANEQGLAHRQVITGLANRVTVGDRSIGYATISALSPLENPPPSEALEPSDPAATPGPVELPGAGGVLVEASTAARLGAATWDELSFEYWRLDERDQLVEDELELVIDEITALSGLGADRTLAPVVPGIADAETIGDWDPPFPVDLSRVTPEDELWWEHHRATPKLFVSLEDARQSWGSRWGSVTALRLVGELDIESFGRALVQGIPLESVGASPRDVRAEALERAEGSTDFGQLFLGFGSFLLGAALLLVALLFGLLAARRGAEVGLLLAIGWPVSRVRRLLLAEGAVVAAAGAIVGAALGIAWAKLLIVLLTSRWSAGIGETDLSLFVQPLSLAIAAIVTFLLALLSLRLALRDIARIAPLGLLRGALSDEGRREPWRGRLPLAIGLGLVSLGLAAAAMRIQGDSAGLAFGSGALALVAGILAVGYGLRRGSTARFGGSRFAALVGLGAGGGRRAPRRATLLVGLVAASSFVVLAVAASTPQAVSVEHGAMGFELLGSASIPLPAGLEDPAKRAELGFSDDDEVVLAGVELLPLRASLGDDTSCLSLGKPLSPRLLGLPLASLQGRLLPTRGTLDGREPLELLASSPADGFPLALGDAEAVTWILRTKLDQTIAVGEDGQRVRIAGLLDHSAFQGELLVSESAFLELFPTEGGFRALLVDVPEGRDVADVAAVLESRLADFGLEVTRTASRLAAYRAVTQTWLDTFRALGGLGLLLGALGVAALVLRAGVERRNELDALVAFGWRRSLLVVLLALEHGMLVLLGLVLGLVAALLATAPARGLGSVFPALGATAPLLGAMLLIALGASALAARGVARER